jgi:hypothetical protein
LRTAASLLLSEGHQHARRYPLATLWAEAELVRERVNARIRTESTLMHAVIVSILSSKKDKSAQRHLDSLLKRLDHG